MNSSRKRARQTSFTMKMFRIEQDKTAMKVCTEACLFGAVVDPEGARHILDVGTGTGLLALMLAQRSTALIDAIDIDDESSQQARDNFAASPYSSRLQAIHADARSWTPSHSYDLVISNPPFFGGSEPGGGSGRKAARHSSSLPLSDLCQKASEWLAPGGRLALLLPDAQLELWEETCHSLQLQPTQVTRLRHTDAHRPNCAILVATLGPTAPGTGSPNLVKTLPFPTDVQSIREADGKSFTPWARRALSPYYLRIVSP